jgi:hypothetical protein
VIVADLDLVGIAIAEPKANAPLVTDGNGVLAPAVVLERVQPIAREHVEIVEPGRQIHVLQLAGGSRRDVRTPCQVHDSLPLGRRDLQVLADLAGEKLFDLAMARNG